MGILAQLHTPQGYVTARVLDLSRAGLRLSAENRVLGIEAPADAEHAGALVRGVLRARFALSLNHERLGSLLQRHVEIERVELPEGSAGTVELCCSFREPLEEAEAELLEAHLPASKTVVPPPERAEPPQGRVLGGAILDMLAQGPVSLPRPGEARTPVGERPRQCYRALVSASHSDSLQTFRCETDLITGVGVRISVPRTDYGDEPSVAANTFAQRYGVHLDLRISDDDMDLWSGRVRVSGVELPTARPDVMLVTLAFDRTLALHELRNLGLVQRVA